MSTRVQILRAATRAAVPWKNGGGLTREVAVHPRGSGFDTLAWRVSIAEIRTAGPFSPFADIDRSLVVLEGALALSIDQQAPVHLTVDSPPLHFGGEVPVYARPQGAVTDLNVLTRRGRFACALALHRGAQLVRASARSATTLILALEDLRVHTDSGVLRLEPLDVVRLEGAESCEVRAPNDAARYYVVELHQLG